MAADIKEQLGFDTELIGGERGIFDVVAEGEMVYSKHAENNEFPNHNELIERLKRVQAR